jgi:hypothetical protein
MARHDSPTVASDIASARRNAFPYDASVEPELPPAPLFGAPTPPRPDLVEPPSERPRTRRGTRVIAFLLVVATTLTAIGGGLLAIERLAAPEGDPTQHGFLDLRIDGSPLRWNPCETIHYVINPSGAPEGSVEDVHEAIRRVSRATGIAFAYDGLTDELPTRTRLPIQRDRYGERWAPVLIAWVDPDETDISFDREGHQAAAVASPSRPLTGEEIFVSGYVALNAEDPNPPGFGWPGAQGPVLLHELGHIMGLAHVREPGEIMEKSGGGVTDYGPGDLEGLRKLGRDAGCLTTPVPV